ncbi:MAG: hypothetical protein ABIA67_06980 [Candidatus Margulisiibacteriota bacterium]
MQGSGKITGIGALTDHSREYFSGQGRVEEAYDASSQEIFYRPFVYGAPPRTQMWGRKWRFSVEWLLGKWFKN